MALAGGLTDYTERKLLAHLLGTETFTPPAFWVALGHPDFGETGTGGTEVTGGGYARQQITAWDPVTVEHIGGPSGYERGQAYTQTASPIVFPVSTGPWSIPNPGWGAIYDAPTGGNALITFLATNINPDFWTMSVAGRQATLAPMQLKLTDRFYDETPGVPGGDYRIGTLYRTWMGRLVKHLVGEATLTPPNLHFCWLISSDASEQFPAVEKSGGGYARVSCNGKWTNPATNADSEASSTLTENVAFPVATAEWGGAAAGLGLVDGATGTNFVADFRFTGSAVAAGNRVVVRPNDVYLLGLN